MGVRTPRVALDEQAADATIVNAESPGLSLAAWLNRAADDALVIEDGLGAVAEWEAKYGAQTAKKLRAANTALDGASEIPADL